MNRTHSRSRTDIDRNYQGGLRSRAQTERSLLSKIFGILRFIVLWGGLLALGTLYYQERLWSNSLEQQADGHMTLITKLVSNSVDLKKNQKRELIDALAAQRLRRCFLIRPFISITCATSLSSP